MIIYSPIRLCLRGSYFFLQRNCGPGAGNSSVSGGAPRRPQGSPAVPRARHPRGNWPCTTKVIVGAFGGPPGARFVPPRVDFR